MILKLLALLNGTLGIGFVTAIVGIGSWSLLISYMILTLGYGVKEAVATSLVCTIITSSSAAPIYLRKRLMNLRTVSLLSYQLLWVLS